MIKIVYHKVNEKVDCPDGIVAASIAASSVNFDCEVFGDSYRHESEYTMPPNPPFAVEQGDRLIIVDFSYPAAWLLHWESLGAAVEVYDHHQPKFAMLSGFIGAVLDERECGATLCWREFFPDTPLSEILRHVRSRDIGEGGYYVQPCPIPESHIINEGLSAWRHDFIAADTPVLTKCRAIAMLINDPKAVEKMFEIGQPIIAERDRIVANAIKRANAGYSPEVGVDELDGHECVKLLLLEQEARHASIIGVSLAHANPSCKFAWLVMPDGSNSLRSCNGFDVAAIARNHGGGGHPAAAGFKDKI